MSFIKEFKDFAMKGNVIDMAVGMVIGGAFTKIVSSLVDDIITPLVLTPALKAANLTDIKDFKLGTLSIGSFISNVITFIIVAFALFLVVKGINATKKKEAEAPAAPPAPSKEEILLGEIRDLLKK